MRWRPIDEDTPQGVILNTCLYRDREIHNEQRLIRKGNLWFFTDMSMYVYYTPTHYQYV